MTVLIDKKRTLLGDIEDMKEIISNLKRPITLVEKKDE
jgi:hypothetical protein